VYLIHSVDNLKWDQNLFLPNSITAAAAAAAAAAGTYFT